MPCAAQALTKNGNLMGLTIGSGTLQPTSAWTPDRVNENAAIYVVACGSGNVRWGHYNATSAYGHKRHDWLKKDSYDGI